MKPRLNVSQAARWAERMGCLYIKGNYQNPMCAVTENNGVLMIGSIEKCRAYVNNLCSAGYAPGQTNPSTYNQIPGTARYLRIDDLAEVVAELDSDEQESRCYLGVREEGIAWSAV